jgi:hypothetical protein
MTVSGNLISLLRAENRELSSIWFDCDSIYVRRIAWPGASLAAFFLFPRAGCVILVIVSEDGCIFAYPTLKAMGRPVQGTFEEAVPRLKAGIVAAAVPLRKWLYNRVELTNAEDV